MIKWVEQPAFEENLFKVGDWVRVYSSGGNSTYDAIVSSTQTDHKDCLFLETRRSLYKPISTSTPHFKQCRLLKIPTPREWCICTEHLCFSPDAFDCDYGGKECKKKWIIVREVLDEPN